jgi:CheY-like chemotaxis protein
MDVPHVQFTGSPLILIVDDFPDALEIYQLYLTVKGYRVMTATSGADAVAMAHAHRPALIFMDLRMADMNGTEAMQAIRANPATAGIGIVALTAHALAEQRRDAMAAGFDEVISKPCLPDELLVAVNRLLAIQRHAV